MNCNIKDDVIYVRMFCHSSVNLFIYLFLNIRYTNIENVSVQAVTYNNTSFSLRTTGHHAV